MNRRQPRQWNFKNGSSIKESVGNDRLKGFGPPPVSIFDGVPIDASTMYTITTSASEEIPSERAEPE